MNKLRQTQKQGHGSWVIGHGVANRDPRFMFHASKGFTLIEIIVVVAIIGTLLTIAGLEVSGWLSNYKVETEIKNMYVDLMNTRARAMQRNRVHFVVLGTKTYTVYEDTNPSPDGDGTLQTGADSKVTTLSATGLTNERATLEHTINWNGSGNITFNTQGIASNLGTINLISAATPDYDCIIIAPTRINLGQYSGSSCNAK